MTSWKTLLVASAASLAFGGAALADAPASPSFAFNAAYGSDYVFRGLSQTFGKGAASGGVDVTFGSFYVGNWDSTVDFGAPKQQFEFDLYGGYRAMLGPVAIDLGGIYYGYTAQPTGSNQAYYEGKLLASYAMGPNTLGGAFYYSPEFFGKTGAAEYYEINDAFTLSNKVTVSGAVGYQALDKTKVGISGYTTWNIGATYPITDHFSIDFRYIGTDDKITSLAGSSVAGDRLVASLKASF